MRKIICFIIVFAFAGNSETIEPEDCRLVLKAENFIVNYEYFSPNIKGYTILGSNIDPSLQVSWNRSLKLNLGVRIRPIFGEYDTIPVYWLYRLQYNSTKNWIIKFGDIEIRSKQSLPDYFMFNNMRFEGPPDNGLLISSPHNWFQSFVIWDDFIFPKSSHQEKLLAGITLSPEFKRDNMSVKIPCAFTASNVGGQIDTSPEPIKTWYHG
ncbi:MAG: hypothetical protein JNL74_17025, partial [Fibrobacteres bacterium]|nr:hypothetical protein [Fibrobacterota bacterium]